jgi:cytochrome c peroxidase
MKTRIFRIPRIRAWVRALSVMQMTGLYDIRQPFSIKLFAGSLVFTAFFLLGGTAMSDDLHSWNEGETGVLRSLWIGSLPPLPKDPSNAFSDSLKAAELGKSFFFDNRFSGNAKVSCATCHRPDMNFTDDLPVAHGMGTGTRRTMPLIGVAYNPWFFWDGRKDSLWSQALAPIENPREHGLTRTQCVSVVGKYYRKEYEEIFGPLPDIAGRDFQLQAGPSPENPAALKKWVFMPQEERDAVNRIYANMGKAIAAFVRTILPGTSRFDRYVAALIKGDREAMEKTLSADEVKGLRLFIAKAKCINCHNGPLFSDGDFQIIHVPDPAGMPADRGRADAIPKVLMDEFNCVGIYSDAPRGDCDELRFMNTNTGEYVGAFKSPTLRNVAERAPYMHAGQLATLREVLEFYRNLKPQERTPQLDHGQLSDKELAQIEAFLRTLSGPVLVMR